MYPGISDLINDLFGTSFTASFPPSFGTMVAISFLLAAWTLGMELKRKEGLGLIIAQKRKVIANRPVTQSEILVNALIGFVIGFKLVYIFSNSDDFFIDPPGILLSAKGNIAGGLAGAVIFALMKIREKRSREKSAPKEVVETVHPHQLVSEITMITALGGLAGAKLFHLFEYWDDFIADPAGMIFSGSGLTMYGGLIVGGLSALWYARKHGIAPLHFADSAAPGVMLAYGTGRLGCQLAGDGDWGIVNTKPQPDWLSFLPDWTWAYTYPNNVINEGIPIEGCTGRFCHELPYPVFPTPLYESVSCILLFFALWAMRKHIVIPGLIFCWYLIFNGIERFMIESIRVNETYNVAGLEFTQAQLISVLLVTGGVAGILMLRKKYAKKHAG